MIYNSVKSKDEEEEDEPKSFEIDFYISLDENNKILKPVLYNSANWLSCYINLSSTVLGAGILGVPFAFSKAGWILGTIFLVSGAVFSGVGLHLLSLCAVELSLSSSTTSFYSVAEKSIPGYSFLIDLIIALKCFGISIAYLIVIGDSLPKAMEQISAPIYLTKRSTCLVLSFLLYGPISYFPTLDALKITSLISGLMIIYLTLLIFCYSLGINNLNPCNQLENITHCLGNSSLFEFNFDTLKMVPIFFFGFSCQQNTFTIVNELKNPTQKRINSVFLASMSTAFVIYSTVCFAGYKTFGNNVTADILKMYPENTLTTISRIMLSIIVAFHYPLQLNPARKCILSFIEKNVLFKNYHSVQSEKNSVGSNLESVKKHWILGFVYFFVTTVFLLLTTAIALSFCDLGIL